jgi:hypothetical protein
MSGRGVHRGATLVLSLAMVVVGLAVLGESIGEHTGGLSSRLLLGVLFVAAGCGRLYLLHRRGSGT